ncbi:MAG: hypothetical protein H8E79_08450 [Desulfobulbaceae bacterium]|uniref:ribonucleoside-diphosphate reductase n=1 Tax=Candidatus Desulfatifera sulfidica TaxID=2841691 RepID=A0A8J6N7B2_9BACT|nr:hypothetical protein [Candidatus Desulfatifera sulfidica]
MTIQSADMNTCDGCGQRTDKLQEITGNEFCAQCTAIARSMQNDPALMQRICALIKSDLSKSAGAPPPCDSVKQRELPEVLDAVRFRTRDRELNTWYVSVSEMEGNPVEIFASTAFDRDQHLQSQISNLTTITRLVSLILRHIVLGEVLTLEKTIKQLHRSSRQKNDLPDMLTRVLSRYVHKPRPSTVENE